MKLLAAELWELDPERLKKLEHLSYFRLYKKMRKEEIEICMAQIIEECRAINIPISRHINPQITINRRAHSRFAACKKIKATSSYEIEVGEMLLQADVKWIKNILAHEILHTCYGCYNHGKRWKAYAAKMNQVYGYEISTTSTYEKLGLNEPERKKTINYVILCQKCGQKIYRQKKSRLVTHTNEYRCKCGGRLISMKVDQG